MVTRQITSSSAVSNISGENEGCSWWFLFVLYYIFELDLSNSDFDIFDWPDGIREPIIVKLVLKVTTLGFLSHPSFQYCKKCIRHTAQRGCQKWKYIWICAIREYISTGVAGAQTHSTFGHHPLHPLILRLLVQYRRYE